MSSTFALGDHRGLACLGCGVKVRAKDPALWLEGSGKQARAWHFDCRLMNVEMATQAADGSIHLYDKKPVPTLDSQGRNG